MAGRDRATLRLPGGPAIELRLRATARARRISLRVSAADGQVTLSFPPRAGRAAALAFAEERADWLRRTLQRLPGPQPVLPGVRLPVAGTPLLLTAAPVRAARPCGDRLLVPQSRPAGPAAAAFLKAAARARIAPAAADLASRIGRRPAAIVLRDTRSRWGSCSAAARLSFSWRLAMAPPAVLDYVVAHEVAHLAEMNHSPAFWALVERLHPGHAAPRAWLRRHGTALQAWRFADARDDD